MPATAQIKTGISVKPVPVIGQYDSLSNFLGGGGIYKYIGQQLYVKPKSEALRKYGYEHFYNTLANEDIFKRVSSYSNNSDYNALADKTFSVISVEKRPIGDYEISLWLDGLDNDYAYFLKLTDGVDTVFYKYPSNDASFPFLVVGYYEKLKQNIGERYYLKKTVDDSLTDYETGASVPLNPGTIWTFVDVVLDGKYYNDVLYIFKNDKGEKISCETYRIKFGFNEKMQGDKLRQKYGVALFNIALQGDIKVGMTKELVRAAWGEPEDINKSSSGEQWVYGNQYLYFTNGVITAFN